MVWSWAAIALLAMTWPHFPGKRAQRPTVPVPAGCSARFEHARDDLIRGGFAPTTDKDTARWLRVIKPSPDVVMLQLEMRTSADGPATFYQLRVYHARPGAEPARWRRRTRPYCCDEHAAREDRLIEHSWTRMSNGFVGDISIVEFEESRRNPDVMRWRDMFAGVGRKAADDCLAAAR
jgi:hypothetical protein